MNMKRILSALLFTVMIFSVLCGLVSCGDTAPEVHTTQATAEETGDPQEVVFPEADYKGEEFTVYARNQNASHYRGFYIIPFEDSADVIDQQAEIRNIRTEEKYNIHFKAIETDAPHETLQTDVATGDIPYKLMLSYRDNMGALALKGLFTNLHYLKCDLTTDWWDKNAAEQYDVADKLYLMPNDVSVSNLACVRFFFFSKGILEDYHVKSPYEYVAEDNWTLDSFLNLVKSVSSPGADGSYGTFGFLNDSSTTVNFMLGGVGVPKMEKNVDGELVCNFGVDYLERAQSFFDRFKEVEQNKNYTLSFSAACSRDTKPDASEDVYIHARQLFMDDHFLFIHTDMEVAAREFTDMKRGFGVVMNPKYDTNQEEYYHPIDSEALIWGIPNDASLDLDMISNVVDFWAYTSKSTVMETFFEVTIKAKRASDPTACEMLDTVKSSIGYYATDIYGVADIRNLLSQSYNSSVATAWKSLQRAIDHQLTNIYDTIDNLDE